MEAKEVPVSFVETSPAEADARRSCVRCKGRMSTKDKHSICIRCRDVKCSMSDMFRMQRLFRRFYGGLC